PNEYFTRKARGGEVWYRADSPGPLTQASFDRIAARLGITNGQITREQYMTYVRQREAERTGSARPGAAGAERPAPRSESPSSPARRDGAREGNNTDAFVDVSFHRLDRNGDGLLSFDEMPEALRSERSTWDANRDGFIDRDEYRAYYRARLQQGVTERAARRGSPSWQDGGRGASAGPVGQDEEDRKPAAYRVGKLPKELPSWFAELGTDKDGQIGLYEWKVSGRPITEFQQMDRNDDGFLTVEEVLRYMRQLQDRSGPGLADSRPGGGL